MKRFILVGANFINLGATALAYTTVSEIRRRYPDSEIYMLSNFYFMNDHSDLNFKVIGLNQNAWNIFMHYDYEVSCAKGAVKILLGKKSDFKKAKNMEAIFKNCDGVFDISGYSLSSQWGEEHTRKHLDIVQKFIEYKVPYYFMPQSFGPFDYATDSKELVTNIKKVLTQSAVIFAREEEGYNYINKLIGKDNLHLSCDLVLQTPKINEDTVFNKVERRELILKTKNNVAIIPNMRNFDHGDKNDVINLYRGMIRQLIGMGKNIYLISHSKEDHEACKLIKDIFINDNTVIHIKENMDIFLFEMLIAQFEFAIASRFHSIVHAYKNGVPCIALGWATKYHELLNLMDQDEYVIDVRNLKDQNEYCSDIIDKMNLNYKAEAERIRGKIKDIQCHNCFEQINF